MIALWQGVNFQSTREETITFHLTSPAHRGIFIHIWKNVYDYIMTGSVFSIQQRRNNYFSFDLSYSQRDLHSYMKECIWLHYDREWIFNPPEKEQLLFIWPLLLTEGSSFIYERMYMIALWQGVNFQSTREETFTFIWHLLLTEWSSFIYERVDMIALWQEVNFPSLFSIHQRGFAFKRSGTELLW